MSILENLLRLRRRQCDEHRRLVADLEALADRLRADAGRVRGAIDDAGPSGDAALVGALAERHLTLERSIGEIEQRIGVARADLAAAEQQLTRHLVARAQRAAAGARSAGRPARPPRPRFP